MIKHAYLEAYSRGDRGGARGGPPEEHAGRPGGSVARRRRVRAGRDRTRPAVRGTGGGVPVGRHAAGAAGGAVGPGGAAGGGAARGGARQRDAPVLLAVRSLR